jgi:hypothetical protein
MLLRNRVVLSGGTTRVSLLLYLEPVAGVAASTITRSLRPRAPRRPQEDIDHAHHSLDRPEVPAVG